MSQVLARKWRPRSFKELVGQEHVVRALSNALRSQRLHHAYLFTGTRGVGKTTLARIISKSLNCETGVTDEPCGKCGACTEIDAGRFIDLIELDAASNTQVDNMRELLDNAMYAPTAGRYKVYIIDEVHMLSRNAFNAMLKTLEEPPEHVKFVLATTDPQKIPVTVLSRCLQFNLKQIPHAQIQARLQHILGEEGLESEPAALALIARAAQGSLRDALSLLDQAIAHGGGKVEADATRLMLGAVDQTYLHAILRALAAGDGASLIAEADRMSARSLSFEMALQDLGTLLHRIALVQIVPQAADEADPDREVLLELAGLFAADELQLYYQVAVQGRAEIGLAPDEYAGFTMTLLRMLAFAPGVAPTGAQPTRTPARVAPPAAAPAARARPPAPVAQRPEPSAAGTTDVPPMPPTPAVTARSATPPPTDASWPEIVARLGLNAMALQLAQHCELVKREAHRIELRLPRANESFLKFQDRLKAALRAHFGDKVNVTITLGETTGASPVEVAARERQRQQAKAVEVIEQDPFVQELVKDFGGRVSSIKPTQ
ncbi:MAG TPA: DNA polymerase III subunit gamma/tau [Burkholderiales bacterium]|nr:DNA polymerase III subunit gamma/tau [Burkholderiales bacterium]